MLTPTTIMEEINIQLNCNPYLDGLCVKQPLKIDLLWLLLHNLFIHYFVNFITS